MRNVFLVLFAWLVFPSFAISAEQPQSTPSNTEAEEKDIRAIIDGYYNAFNAHDAKKMASFYADDGDLRTPWNEFGKDKSEIEKIFNSEHNARMKNAHIEYEIKQIRMIKPNIALVDAETTIKGMQTQTGTTYPPFKHFVVLLLVKRNGIWQILDGRPF